MRRRSSTAAAAAVAAQSADVCTGRAEGHRLSVRDLEWRSGSGHCRQRCSARCWTEKLSAPQAHPACCADVTGKEGTPEASCWGAPETRWDRV